MEARNGFGQTEKLFHVTQYEIIATSGIEPQFIQMLCQESTKTTVHQGTIWVKVNNLVSLEFTGVTERLASGLGDFISDFDVTANYIIQPQFLYSGKLWIN